MGVFSPAAFILLCLGTLVVPSRGSGYTEKDVKSKDVQDVVMATFNIMQLDHKHDGCVLQPITPIKKALSKDGAGFTDWKLTAEYVQKCGIGTLSMTGNFDVSESSEKNCKENVCIVQIHQQIISAEIISVDDLVVGTRSGYFREKNPNENKELLAVTTATLTKVMKEEDNFGYGKYDHIYMHVEIAASRRVYWAILVKFVIRGKSKPPKEVLVYIKAQQTCEPETSQDCAKVLGYTVVFDEVL